MLDTITKKLQLTVAFLALVCVSAAVSPSIAHVDLVFPRDNVLYRPMFPFPIVFVLRNFPGVWWYRPVLAWQLYEIQSQESKNLRGMGNMGFINNGQWSDGWGPPTSSHLAINHSFLLGQEFERKRMSAWRLDWDFSLTPRAKGDSGFCLKPGSQAGDTRISHEFKTHGSVYFNTSLESGILPSFTNRDFCPKELSAISYLERSDNKFSNSTCDLMQLATPSPDLCGHPLSERSIEVLSQVMANATVCKGLNSADTGTKSWCPESTSSTTKLTNNLRLSTIALVTCVVSFIW